MDAKTCNACAMEISAKATKCPYCLTRQANAPTMTRDLPDRKIAGVCAAVAQQLSLDPVLVRVAFAVAAILSGGMAVGIYLLLWMATPERAGERSLLTKMLDMLDGLMGGARKGQGQPTPEPPPHV